MKEQEALDFVLNRLSASRNAALDKGSKRFLRDRIQVGKERALAEKDEESFDGAVAELAELLVQKVMLVAVEGGEVTAMVTEESIEMAWRDICPLWPFC